MMSETKEQKSKSYFVNLQLEKSSQNVKESLSYDPHVHRDIEHPTTMWTLIFLIESDGDKLPDLIPDLWKIDERSCWYPKNCNMNVIKSLAKHQTCPDHAGDDWECCVMKIVETDISDFEVGLKMMYKLAKNVSNLYSDHELRGRGMRVKRKTKIAINDDLESSDEEQYKNVNIKKKVKTTSTSYPVFPVENNGYDEIENNPSTFKDLFEKEIESDVSQLNLQSPAGVINGSAIGIGVTCSDSNKNLKCKLSKRAHDCTFEENIKNNTEMLLVSIAHQLCKISAENKKLKSSINYIKQELTSFIEDKPYALTHGQMADSTEDNILAPFPLKTEDDLQRIETKLETEDLAYTNKLVTSFIFASEGKTVPKVTNNLLKTVFTYELASNYSWKGQKEKKPLNKLNIFKVIIATVCKKFSTDINAKFDATGSIKTWFAQAPFRGKLQKKVQENEELIDL